MNLYKNLSVVYHKMYQSLFDYDKEFDFYSTVLHNFSVKSVLEYGCGTGNLASRFLTSGFEYLGIDLNREMLDIAKKNLPNDNFVLGNLKTFQSDQKFDCALITGRTISYLINNEEVLESFKSIAKNVKNNGVLIFDAIDASSMFEDFDEEKKEITVGNYVRIGTSAPNLKTGWTWDWSSEYFEKKENELKSLGKDHAVVRAFIKDEIKLFLAMSGFELLEVIDKETYMWKSHYYVARKKQS
ncbi:class I SAM-dependent DNA methyltransferase [Aquimarina mytili]|uniref:Class I SAM-dependent methyltransferase n=1 Tax=Aquimarina mytili TaxID=874423 RepID=A0A937DAT8_9FLAO|nr:class I SAM-dependent methyltransferase [Aquimarina mytili]MBL0683081.1 class I SAM-dependent methyltransferase [Aquimarina mytili]